MKNLGKAVGLVAVGMVTSMASVAQESDWKPMLNMGTQEVSLSGNLEFPDFDRLDYDIDLSYGYFIRDGWQIGAELGASDFGGTDRADLTAFTEYNFNRHQKWVPYVGAAIGVASVSFNDNDFDSNTNLDDDDGWVFDVEVGIKWFVRPYMAISTAIDFQFATNDIYATDDEIEDNLTSLQLGMRFYF